MFALKPISHDGVAGALAKAERYRLLNEPNAAESICHAGGPGAQFPAPHRSKALRAFVKGE